VRLAENANRVQFPQPLGGWLATTARREFLHILRQARLGQNFTNMIPETISGPSMSPEEHTIDAHTTRTLQKLIDNCRCISGFFTQLVQTRSHIL
jgi:DNA-directed RNA polymerase specialized sigma24 family protein